MLFLTAFNLNFKSEQFPHHKKVAGGGFEPPFQGPEPRRIDHYPTRLLDSKINPD